MKRGSLFLWPLTVLVIVIASSCSAPSNDASFSVDGFMREMKSSGLQAKERRVPRAPSMMGPGAQQRFLLVGPVDVTTWTFTDERIARRAERAIDEDGSYLPKVSKDGRIMNGAIYGSANNYQLFRRGPVIMQVFEPDSSDDPSGKARGVIAVIKRVMGESFAGIPLKGGAPIRKDSDSRSSKGTTIDAETFIGSLRDTGLAVHGPLGGERSIFGPGAKELTYTIGESYVSVLTFDSSDIARKFLRKVSPDGTGVPEVSRQGRIHGGGEAEWKGPMGYFRRDSIIVMVVGPWPKRDNSHLRTRILRATEKVMGPMLLGRGKSRDSTFSVDDLVLALEEQGMKVARTRLLNIGLMGPGANHESLVIKPVGMTAYWFEDEQIARMVAQTTVDDGSYAPRVSKSGRILGGSTVERLSKIHMYRKGPVILWLDEPAPGKDSDGKTRQVITAVVGVMGEQFAGN